MPVILVGLFRSRKLWPIPRLLRRLPEASLLAVATHGEAILNERDAEACSRAELRSMGGVEQVREHEAHELERDADEHVPQEGEERARGEAVDNHLAGFA